MTIDEILKEFDSHFILSSEGDERTLLGIYTKNGVNIKDFLKQSLESYAKEYAGREFLRSLAGEIEKHGIETPSKDKVFGLLEAQTKHLADLRTMLHLDPPQSAKPPEGEIKL